MRPALERLLKRPSSIELLAYLIGNASIPLHITSAECRRCVCQKDSSRRLYTSIATPIRRVAAKKTDSTYDIESRLNEILRRAGYSHLNEALTEDGGNYPLRSAAQSDKGSGICDGKIWKEDELEFESDLGARSTSRQRLVDLARYSSDLRLWVCLLEYRQRIYGSNGTKVIWNAMRKKGVRIPTEGPLASIFWTAFISAGVQHEMLLHAIWEYADNIYQLSGERWPLLYISIIQRLLLKGRGQEAINWHHILIKDHPPDPKDFANMFHQMVLKGGDLSVLKTIYKKNNYRGIYANVIPVLCDQEDFNAAFEWHFLLMRHNDPPLEPKMVEPLILHLAVYDREKASQVTKSLVDKAVPFGPLMSSTLNGYNTISREVMNLIHGQTFHVKVKPYNDNLGARWFATKWVSLDLAINTIHALGVQEIGPLSLQAIALRDTDCKIVYKRIDQLRQLGISIGSSYYSRAIEEFARKGNSGFLEGLLSSDQHPDALEDWKLQEALLSHYAKNQDWSQYRRTLAIRLLGSESYDTEIQNHTLISQVTRRDIPAMLETLSNMNISGIPVRAKTVGYILRTLLRPRQRGRAPVSEPNSVDDLSMGINVLIDILNSGGFVPITYWREIIRRLGMLGRFDELDRLSIFLVSWYAQSRDSARKEPLGYKPKYQRRTPPVQVSTSHPLHPLRILFPVSLQKAIVEWGFIHGLARQEGQPNSLRLINGGKSSQYSFTRGILLLKKLSQHGVDIDSAAIRSAIFNRLLIYYGPGQSNRLYNRAARARNRLKLEEMAKEIDIALGSPAFPGLDLRQAIEKTGHTKRRMRRGGSGNLPQPTVNRIANSGGQ
ncbi:hypothetical protein B7463_g6364, partial [Scytalidium lignicola]